MLPGRPRKILAKSNLEVLIKSIFYTAKTARVQWKTKFFEKSQSKSEFFEKSTSPKGIFRGAVAPLLVEIELRWIPNFCLRISSPTRWWNNFWAISYRFWDRHFGLVFFSPKNQALCAVDARMSMQNFSEIKWGRFEIIWVLYCLESPAYRKNKFFEKSQVQNLSKKAKVQKAIFGGP